MARLLSSWPIMQPHKSVAVRSMKKSLFMLFAVCFLASWSLAQPHSALPNYQPKPVSLPKNTRYVQPNGTVRIYGSAKLKTVIERLNATFLKSRKGIQFSTQRMKGENVGIPGLTYDVTPFAPLSRAYAEWETTAYEKVVGEPPIELVGASFDKSDLKAAALYFYVRKAPNVPVNDFVNEYFRLVFSKQGQQIVESSGFKPLSATEAAKELAKLSGGKG